MGGEVRRMMEVVNSSMIYCKNCGVCSQHKKKKTMGENLY
jgi:hypothetical protein